MPTSDFFKNPRPRPTKLDSQHLVMFRQDTLRFTAVIVNGGVPVDITGGFFWFTAKRDRNHTDAQALIRLTSGSGITALVPLQGQIEVVLNPIDTINLNLSESETLYWDIQYQDRFGNVATVFDGKITIYGDTTVFAGHVVGLLNTSIGQSIGSISGWTYGMHQIQSGYTSGVNERQGIRVSGPSGGTFTLTVENPRVVGSLETTAAIAYNATQSVIKSALENLTFIDQVSLSGAIDPSVGEVIIEFSGPIVQQINFSPITIDGSLLT